MSDDLTRLTDEEREALWQSGEVSSINTEPDSNLVAVVESILAARTAALIDRAERAERERDRLARLECGCASCYRPGEYSPMQCPTLAKQMGDNDGQ